MSNQPEKVTEFSPDKLVGAEAEGLYADLLAAIATLQKLGASESAIQTWQQTVEQALLKGGRWLQDAKLLISSGVTMSQIRESVLEDPTRVTRMAESQLDTYSDLVMLSSSSFETSGENQPDKFNQRQLPSQPPRLINQAIQPF